MKHHHCEKHHHRGHHHFGKNGFYHGPMEETRHGYGKHGFHRHHGFPESGPHGHGSHGHNHQGSLEKFRHGHGKHGFRRHGHLKEGELHGHHGKFGKHGKYGLLYGRHGHKKPGHHGGLRHHEKEFRSCSPCGLKDMRRSSSCKCSSEEAEQTPVAKQNVETPGNRFERCRRLHRCCGNRDIFEAPPQREHIGRRRPFCCCCPKNTEQTTAADKDANKGEDATEPQLSSQTQAAQSAVTGKQMDVVEGGQERSVGEKSVADQERADASVP